MDIRIATMEDYDLVYSMAVNYAKQGSHGKFADEKKIAQIVQGLLTQSNDKTIVLLWKDKAGIAGGIAQFVHGTDPIATEMALWVDPEFRGQGIATQLIEAFEFWAKRLNCSAVILSDMSDGFGELYTKKGYSLHERAYLKEI